LARKTNYRRERQNRAEAKAAKREAKRQAKANRANLGNPVERSAPDDGGDTPGPAA
jgi:hypothetical protein